MARVTTTVEVEFGPALRMCLDVLDAAKDMIREAPAWADTDEIDNRITTLADECQRMLDENHRATKAKEC